MMLADNVRRLYESAAKRKDDWLKTLHAARERERQWTEELAEYGVKREQDLGFQLGMAMAAGPCLVPDPPIALDAMTWLAEQLQSKFRFFVPYWSEYRFIVPPGFGAQPGLYEGTTWNVASQVDDRDALLRDALEWCEREKFVAIQLLEARFIPAGAPEWTAIGPCVTDPDAPERTKVLLTGVQWDEDWAESPCKGDGR